MAKTNKYTSINYNHIYDKDLSPNSKTGNNPSKNPSSSSSSSSSSFASATYSSISSANKSHGRMLVLTRPTPKPISSLPVLSPQPQSRSPSADPRPVADQTHPQCESDSISLRPLGRTGTGAIAPSPIPNLEKDKEIPPPTVTLHKPEKFVPPHLRAGFVGKEERPVNVGIRSREANQRQYGNYGSPGRYGEDGRPKSGGANERMNGAGEADQGEMVNRPRSSGNRPNSSGCASRDSF
ncbi:uncharacterized protein LOC111468300 isoform X1 [Cucurbita maxima]|uniref:Uncharacterized protein LOC111468300 isoform X1 n=1 Tax=Cucurbita maxima TaxID=3661 RepID=A0A6J1HX94_CUCMA|nr:uncharacterized protein LOC111468300 isoform X1 [Cucurbita maxima]